MIQKPLPPHCYPAGKIRKIIGAMLHFTSAENVDPKNAFDVDACWRMLHDLNLEKGKRLYYPDVYTDGTDNRTYASYNELIGRNDGEDYILAPYFQQAYHAGITKLDDLTNLNEWMPGICLVGNKTSGYTDWQYKTSADAVAILAVTFKFDPRTRVLGHDRARFNAIQAGMKNKYNKTPDFKYDPSGQKDGLGKNFDWPRFFALVDDGIRQHTAGT